MNQIEPCRALEEEGWLREDPEALEAVKRGLRQAKSQEFAQNPPDLDTAGPDGEAIARTRTSACQRRTH